MKLNHLLASVVLPATLSFAVTSQAETGVSDDQIRLGMVNVQTGPASALGKGMLAGSAAVFKEINLKGGVHGRKIELLVGDDGYEPERAIDETLVMIEDEEVFSLFGYVGTPTSNAVIPIVKEMEVPLVGLFTGAGTLRSPVTRQIFNIRASYNDEAEAMVEHFVANGAKTVSVFYQNDGFGKAVLSGAKKALTKRGMAVHSVGTFERNTMAVKGGLAKMVESNPDAIIMVGTYAPLAEFVKQARANGLNSMMSTVSFVGTNSLVNAVGEAGDGVIITQVVPFPYQNDLALVNNCRELVKKHSKVALDYVTLEGCLSAKVMVLALEKAGRDLTRDSLIDALHEMKKVSVEGVMISFAADNHQALNQVYVSEIRGGKINQLD
ncbi:MAG: ABC transporter substrate-binding protein [Burkholderiaceae bacterium]